MTREEAIAILENEKPCNDKILKYSDDILILALDMAIEALKQEPKTGRWIDIDDSVECSECGHREKSERFIFDDINFCAKCGADMRGEK